MGKEKEEYYTKLLDEVLTTMRSNALKRYGNDGETLVFLDFATLMGMMQMHMSNSVYDDHKEDLEAMNHDIEVMQTAHGTALDIGASIIPCRCPSCREEDTSPIIH